FAATGGARGYVCAAEHGGFDYLSLAADLQARCPGVQRVVVAGESAGVYSALRDIEAAGAGIDVPATVSSAQDIAFLQISGGTTGLSKLIPRTHDDYIYTLPESAHICGMDGNGIMLCALPMAHNFPMSSPGFLGTLY